MIRGRRAFLRAVPSAICLADMLSHRETGPRGIGTRYTVKPYKNRWEWAVELTFNGRGSLSRFSEGGSWRRRGPHELHGRSSTRADATERARSIVNDVKSAVAATRVGEMRTHTDRVPL